MNDIDNSMKPVGQDKDDASNGFSISSGVDSDTEISVTPETTETEVLPAPAGIVPENESPDDLTQSQDSEEQQVDTDSLSLETEDTLVSIQELEPAKNGKICVSSAVEPVQPAPAVTPFNLGVIWSLWILSVGTLVFVTFRNRHN